MNLLLLAWLKSDRSTCRDVQAHATSGCSIELERIVDFEKVIVTAHLYRPVTSVANHEFSGRPTHIGLNGRGFKEVFSWFHWHRLIGWGREQSLVLFRLE